MMQQKKITVHVKVTTDPGDVDQESLLEQCAAFYNNPLKEAVIQAF